ncbi:MAG: quinolinate synthase NadA [Elusimicrobiota bacterium]|nr:MAG: quinolinate synthase NadA [Elusimicrobiota bacterium]
MALKTLSPSQSDIEQEAARLSDKGLGGLGYRDEELERAAALTWRINRLKMEKKAVIPAHVYQRPEILLGVADMIGDSYRLAKLGAASDAEIIVFCGVRFMAETAKILSPDKTVLLPAPEAGCSLSESITAADVRALKKKHPGAPVAVYINTSVAVKAECDVVVTSANAPKIMRRLYETHDKVIFAPDAMMGANLAKELGKTIGKDLIVWNGTCIVHDNFDAASVEFYRKMYPGVKILAHFECTPALTSVVDYIGGTGDMMKWVDDHKAPSYMLITECGLGDLARTKFPDKAFVPMCRLCPHMKAVTLERVLSALEKPSAAQTIEVPPSVAARALKPIERMFELAEDRAAA